MTVKRQFPLFRKLKEMCAVPGHQIDSCLMYNCAYSNHFQDCADEFGPD